MACKLKQIIETGIPSEEDYFGLLCYLIHMHLREILHECPIVDEIEFVLQGFDPDL